jgi:aminoglycoside phosphotransferase (APT) family kinase protein
VALPSQRDPEKTRERLREWLAARLEGSTDVHVGELGGPAYNGYSHETLMFDASWNDHGRGHSQGFVARVEPSSHSIFFDQDVGIEARVMRAMTAAGVLAPKVHWHEEDPDVLGAPFLVMERIAGQIPADNPPYTFGGWVSEGTGEEQALLWWTGLEGLAAVHMVDPAPLGFLQRPIGQPGADAELAYISDYIDRVCGDERHAVMDAGLDWLNANRPAAPEPIRVCWGDSRIGNQIFDHWRCAALLDWEMAALGNPEQDLAWYLYFDRLFSEGLMSPRPPGFPSHADSIARYEEITGIHPVSLDFYEVLASLRFAVILMRLGQLMVWSGVLPEDTEFGSKSFAVEFLAKLLEERGVPSGR